MLTYVKPGDGRIPAFNPICPGIHCGFCWADTYEAPIKDTNARMLITTLMQQFTVVSFLLNFLDIPFAASFGFCIAGELLTRFYVRVLRDTSLVRGDVGKDDFHHPAYVHLVAEEAVSLT